jgi:hypothetical protein
MLTFGPSGVRENPTATVTVKPGSAGTVVSVRRAPLSEVAEMPRTSVGATVATIHSFEVPSLHKMGSILPVWAKAAGNPLLHRLLGNERR